MNSELSDLRLEGLVAQAQQGDTNALNKLIAEVDPWLQKEAKRLVQDLARDVFALDKDLANEASQETCVVLMEKVSHYRPVKGIKAWLCGILENTILKLRRKELRFRGSLPFILESDDGSVVIVEPADKGSLTPEQAALREETIQCIRGCVARLPAEPREAILSYLCFKDAGRKRKEVAQQLGVSDPTLASRLKKARRLLRECLEREGLRPESPLPESQKCYSFSDNVAYH